MKVAGFTFIRNAIKNDYAVVEAITSILPICDEFIVAIGKSDDDTKLLIEAIQSPKIKIIETIWNDNNKEGGSVFAEETDKAFAAISEDVDWAFYIQGDECVHERYLPVIKQEMEINLRNSKVEGLLFKYLHFYGSYDFYGQSRRWYRREIRVVKRKLNVKSYRDAQGFRIDGRKINVKLIDAYIYHYGWVKPPVGLKNKVLNFNTFYHEQDWINENLGGDYEFDYDNADFLVRFTDSHPEVMKKRIQAINWEMNFDPKMAGKKMNFRRKVLQKIELVTGLRIGEYKNYEVVN